MVDVIATCVTDRWGNCIDLSDPIAAIGIGLLVGALWFAILMALHYWRRRR